MGQASYSSNTISGEKTCSCPFLFGNVSVQKSSQFFFYSLTCCSPVASAAAINAASCCLFDVVACCMYPRNKNKKEAPRRRQTSFRASSPRLLYHTRYAPLLSLKTIIIKTRKNGQDGATLKNTEKRARRSHTKRHGKTGKTEPHSLGVHEKKRVEHGAALATESELNKNY